MRLEEVAADFLNPLPKPARTSRPTYGTTGSAMCDGKVGEQDTRWVALMKSAAGAPQMVRANLFRPGRPPVPPVCRHPQKLVPTHPHAAAAGYLQATPPPYPLPH